jgi:hypothetical protein
LYIPGLRLPVPELVRRAARDTRVPKAQNGGSDMSCQGVGMHELATAGACSELHRSSSIMAQWYGNWIRRGASSLEDERQWKRGDRWTRPARSALAVPRNEIPHARSGNRRQSSAFFDVVVRLSTMLGSGERLRTAASAKPNAVFAMCYASSMGKSMAPLWKSRDCAKGGTFEAAMVRIQKPYNYPAPLNHCPRTSKRRCRS